MYHHRPSHSQRVQGGLCSNTLPSLKETKNESIIPAVPIPFLLKPLKLAVSWWRSMIWKQAFLTTTLFTKSTGLCRPLIVDPGDLGKVRHHLHLAQRGDACSCLDVVRWCWNVNLGLSLPSFLWHFLHPLLGSLDEADRLTAPASSTLARLHQSCEISFPLVARLVLLQYV